MRKMQIGDIVYLNDRLSLHKNLQKAGIAASVICDVRSYQHIKIEQVADYHIYELSSDIGDLFLLYKIVDNEMDTRIYERIDDVFGDRKELYEKGLQWLFEPPKNENTFNSKDANHLKNLEYVKEIFNEIDGNKINYVIKPQGVLHGRASYSYMSDDITTIIEYSTGEDTNYDQLLLLEEGSMKYGGIVRLFQGYNISETEVEVFNK